MNELNDNVWVERLLEAMPLRQPSASLDERIEALASEAGGIGAVEARPTVGVVRRIGWLAGVSGMAAGLVIGVLAWPLLTGVKPTPGGGGEVANAAGSGASNSTSTAASTADGSIAGSAVGSPAGNTERVGASNDPIEATVATTKLVDEGVVVVNEKPVRKIRRVTTRQMLYYDESNNERVEVTVPEEEVYFLSSEPF